MRPGWRAWLRGLRLALRHGQPPGGEPGWCRREIVDGLWMEYAAHRPVRLCIAVNAAWPLGIVPHGVEVAEGRLPLRAVRVPPLRAQCASVYPQAAAGTPRLFGTVGFLALDAFDAGSTFAVTAGHVLGGSARAAFDDPVVIEEPVSGLRTDSARVSQWSTPLAAGDRFPLDAGLVRLMPGDRGRLLAAQPRLLADGWSHTPPADGAEVQLLRADGTVLSGVSGQTKFERAVLVERLNADGSTEETTIWLRQVQTCRLWPAPQPGDSGAAIVASINGQSMLVGIHCAYSPNDDPGGANAYYTLVGDIADHFDIVPLTRQSLSQPVAVRQRPARRTAEPRPPVLAPPPVPTPPPTQTAAIDTLARTLWGEARGEGEKGMEAVACVVMNRVSQPGWWGDSVITVCRKPFQFSCWNPGTSSLRELLKVTPADKAFALALNVAGRAVGKQLADFTYGALHYHTRDSHPKWSLGKEPCFELGRHVFYNNIR